MRSSLGPSRALARPWAHREERTAEARAAGQMERVRAPCAVTSISPSRTLVVGTRGSALALRQTEMVVAAIRARYANVDIVVRRITTRGDVMRDVSLSSIAGRGVFVDAIEQALRDGEIDLAVHSAKDLPSVLPADMRLAAVLERADARDVLVAPSGTLSTLPRGARIGTSSLRRAVQLREMDPDVDVREMRGNVDTRLAKLDRGDYDGIVLAAAGLVRLGLAARIAQWFDPMVVIPSPGQGALAIEIRADDEALGGMLAPLGHTASEQAVLAERAFLARLGAGCAAAVGAYARVRDATLEIRAFIGAPSGRAVRDRATGSAASGEETGRALAERMIRAGGAGLIAEAGPRAADSYQT